MSKQRVRVRAGTNAATTADNFDGWANVASGRGITDKTAYDMFAPSGELRQETLSLLYERDWLARKVCERPAKDATRKGITIKDADEKPVLDELERIGFSEKAKDGISWGRLYGGTGLVLLVEDGKEVSEPLDTKAVKRLIDVMVLDENYLSGSGVEVDPSSVNYGMPTHYRVNGGELFHASRICKFTGASLTYDKKMKKQGWGGSYVQLYWDAIKSFQTSMHDLQFIVSDSSLGILSVPGLTNKVAMGGKVLDAIQGRAEAFNLAKSLYRTAMLDADETFAYINRSLAGLSDLADRFMTCVSGATELPQLILFGTTPGGLNASQEEQLDSYYDTITAIQEGELMQAYNKVIECITGGRKVEWDYKPLAQLSDTKRAAVRLQEAQAAQAVADIAGLTPDAVVKHLNDTGHFNFDVVADEEIPDEAVI